MKDHLQRELIDLFGDRAAFVDARPGRAPDAVVWPIDAGEVEVLLQFALRHRLPVVPRGAATSGYGGSEPVRGGIVIDFTAMNRLLALVPEVPEAIVEPGMTWQALETYLHRRGYGLRAYPSSGAVSTVGGWAAAGGIGIGSYAYGAVEDNLSWIELALLDGKRVRLTSDNMQLAVGAQGITGLIVAIGVRLRPRAVPEVAMAATFRRLADFLRALVDMYDRQLPLWHVSLVSAALDRDADLEVPASDGDPTAFPLTRHTAIVAFPDLHHPPMALDIRALLFACGAVPRPGFLGASFWEDRWGATGLGFIGPSVANGAVMLPTIRLAALFRAARDRGWPARLVCNFSGRGWTSARLLSVANGVLPDGLAREWLALAGSHGARPYGVDPGALVDAELVISPDLHEYLLAFKRRQDPWLLLNPGKRLAVDGSPGAGSTLDKLSRVLQRLQEQSSGGEDRP